MCYIHGSVEQAISTCSMCKVFRPTAARCPHVREICRNRQLHPSHDVVFIKNAEVQTFNGCGYCKWASANPLVRAPGAQNPGWPGCCRPPSASEARFIPPADWQAVMTVHKVPPPPEIKALLDSARGMVTAPPPARSQASPKTSENPQLGTPPKSPVALTKSAPQVSIPGKGSRSNTSPKQPISPLAREASRASPVLPSAPPPELRRTASSRDASRRENSPGTRIAATMSAGSRRSLDQQPTESVTVGRRSTNSKRPPLAAAMAQMTLEDPRQNLKRRGSNAPDGQNASPPRLTDVKNTGSTSTRSAKKSASVEDMKAGSGARPSPPAIKASSGPKSPSSASSDGTASTFSESTVTSEGFTDYLSDESEAELQRQAEVRAAKAAQNAEEDMEFRSARKALARVDLRPPTSWRSATVGTRSGKGYPPPNGFDSRQQVNIMELARSK